MARSNPAAVTYSVANSGAVLPERVSRKTDKSLEAVALGTAKLTRQDLLQSLKSPPKSSRNPLEIIVNNYHTGTYSSSRQFYSRHHDFMRAVKNFHKITERCSGDLLKL